MMGSFTLLLLESFTIFKITNVSVSCEHAALVRVIGQREESIIKCWVHEVVTIPDQVDQQPVSQVLSQGHEQPVSQVLSQGHELTVTGLLP